MAEPHSNSISLDTIEVRLYRLLRTQNNIDTYAALLGVSGTLLLWAQGCYDRYFAAVVASQNEDGESKDATIILHDAFAVALDYYQQAKDILNAKLRMFKPDELLRASYGIDKSTPDTYHALTIVIADLIDTHDKLVAALDERVIAQGIIDQLKIHGDTFLAQIETAGIERRETNEAFNQQHTFYAEDTENLRYIFTIAKLIFGDDDPKLKDLGFVPSSEVWTPGSGDPEPGTVAWPDVPTGVKIQLVKLGDNEFFVISADEYTGNTGFDVRVAWGETGGAVAEMPAEDTMTNVPFNIQYPGEVMHGMTIYVWVRARNGDEVTDWAEVASLDVE